MMRQLILACVLAFAYALPANAVPILVGATTDATGINGLVIGAVEYDVTFSFLSFDDSYGTNTPTFFGDEPAATDAVTALAAALNAFGVTGLNGIIAEPFNGISLSIPTSFFVSGQINEALAFTAVSGIWEIEAPGVCAICNTAATPNRGEGWVVFERSLVSVPEPGSLALLGLGVAGMVFVRRRKKA